MERYLLCFLFLSGCAHNPLKTKYKFDAHDEWYYNAILRGEIIMGQKDMGPEKYHGR